MRFMYFSAAFVAVITSAASAAVITTTSRHAFVQVFANGNDSGSVDYYGLGTFDFHDSRTRSSPSPYIGSGTGTLDITNGLIAPNMLSFHMSATGTASGVQTGNSPPDTFVQGLAQSQDTYFFSVDVGSPFTFNMTIGKSYPEPFEGFSSGFFMLQNTDGANLRDYVPSQPGINNFNTGNTQIEFAQQGGTYTVTGFLPARATTGSLGFRRPALP